MKVLLRYQKIGGAEYLSHLDIVRAFNRTIRRAGLDINYSQGFNPHMLLFFSQPLPMYVASEYELCVADCNTQPQEFLQKFNAVAPQGIKILHAKEVQSKAVLSEATHSLYEFCGNFPANIDAFFAQEKIIVQRKEKEINIKPQIFDYFLKEDDNQKMYVCMAYGANNLRADVFFEAFCKFFDCPQKYLDITRKIQYNITENKKSEIF